MSAYYAAGGPAQASATEQSAPAPVLVSFAGPAPQSRVTVLFRLLMAIPQLIVLWVLGIAAFVVTVIGWFGALFTGRLPVFAADFLTGYLRWLARVYAYLYMLTDVYPPFALDDADYPVRLAAMPGRLNRLVGPVPHLPADPLPDRPDGDRVRRAHRLPVRELADRADQGPDAGHDLPGHVGGAALPGPGSRLRRDADQRVPGGPVR